ncbi:hypothetical protein ACEQPO_18415 [Bacillus sp. SL00103]
MMGMIFPIMMLFISINAPLPSFILDDKRIIITIQTIILNVMYQKSKSKAEAKRPSEPTIKITPLSFDKGL